MSEILEKPKKHWIEPAAAILMAITTLATTWCSFQSSKWSGKSGRLAAQAGNLDRKAHVLSAEGLQVQAAQLGIFMQLLDARLAGNDRLVKFYEERIGGEFKPAYEAWLAQKPFENPKADPHPFGTNLYTARFSREAAEARAEAAHNLQEAGRIGNVASRYLSNTVMLAAVLFFVGTSTRFDSRRVRKFSFLFGAALFLYVAVRMMQLPVTT
jgi:hypothetical protein